MAFVWVHAAVFIDQLATPLESTHFVYSTLLRDMPFFLTLIDRHITGVLDTFHRALK